MSILRMLAAVCGLLALSSAPARAAVLTLTWDPPPDAAGYVLHYGTASGHYTNHVDVGNKTTYRLDLPGGTRYYFAVSAYNQAGLSSHNSVEISAVIDADVPGGISLDLPFEIAPTAVDIAYEGWARRYLVAYEVSGQIWGLLLDVWGDQATPPFLIEATGTNSTPRIAAGGGGFLVTYTQAGQRYARSITGVGGLPTVASPIALGSASDSSAAFDGAGNGVIYMPDHNTFLATWRNSSDVVARAVTKTGLVGTAISVTGDAHDANCVYERSEIAWDPTLGRGLVVGNRAGSSCATGDAVWSRLVTFDGTRTSMAGDLTTVSTSAGPHTFRRVAFSDFLGRFLVAWSEPRASRITVMYRWADATGGMSAPFGAPGANSTADEGDSFADQGLAAFGSGFALVSRGAASPDAVDGRLHLFRIGTEAGAGDGLAQRLPARGGRMYTALASNSTTGQIVAAYLTGDKRLQTLTLGARVPTTLTLMRPNGAVTVGAAMSVYAQAAGGVGPHEYEIWKYHSSNGWIRLQGYDTNQSVTWTPSIDDVGEHTFQVWTRSAGSAANYEAWGSVQVNVSGPPPRTVTVSPNKSSVPFGSGAVTWTAASTGGWGTPEYQFWIYNGSASTWSMGRAWGTSDQFSWTPPTEGNYTIQVWARRAGTTGYEAWSNSAPTTVTPPQPLSVSVSVNRVTGWPGLSFVWQATTQGGIGPSQLEFWRYDIDAQTWTRVQPYGSGTSYTWTPTTANVGSYLVQVWARPSTSQATTPTAVANSSTIKVTNVTLTGLTSSVTTSGTYRVGTSVTWTATATITLGTIEYQYWVYSHSTGTWQVMRAYGTSRTASWTPTAPGRYTVQVWARTVGSTRPYEVWRATAPFDITP